jgi:hypothetical protein
VVAEPSIDIYGGNVEAKASKGGKEVRCGTR